MADDKLPKLHLESLESRRKDLFRDPYEEWIVAEHQRADRVDVLRGAVAGLYFVAGREYLYSKDRTQPVKNGWIALQAARAFELAATVLGVHLQNLAE